jgi:hypothetical protein
MNWQQRPNRNKPAERAFSLFFLGAGKLLTAQLTRRLPLSPIGNPGLLYSEQPFSMNLRFETWDLNFFGIWSLGFGILKLEFVLGS